MLEIFDENGETSLSVNDSTTRILAIYHKQTHGGRLPSLPENLQKIQAEPNARPFMVVNTFFEINKVWLPQEQLLAPAEHLVANDIAVLGVYYV